MLLTLKTLLFGSGPEYEFDRKGTFHLTSWCWTAAERDLTFHVHIRTPQLDEHGFIVDNVMVENYFTQKFGGKKLDASCEMIATEALKDFCQFVPYASYIMIAISGSPDVTWLTAEAPTRRHVRTLARR